MKHPEKEAACAPASATSAAADASVRPSATAMMATLPVAVSADACDGEAPTLHPDAITRARPAPPRESPELRALRSLPVKALAPVSNLGYRARGNDLPARPPPGIGKRLALVALASAVLGGVAAAVVDRPQPPPKLAAPIGSAAPSAAPTTR